MKKPFYKMYDELLSKTIISGSVSTEEYINQNKSIINLVRNNIPKRLFRYRSCNEISIDAFKNNRIYFNSPNNFNDPNDSLIFINLKQIQEEFDSFNKNNFSEMIKHIIKTKEIPEYFKILLPKEIINNILSVTNKQFEKYINDNNIAHLLSYIEDKSYINLNTLIRVIRSSVMISCFSEEIYQPLMWSYYADSHKGFALEYDFTKIKHKCDNCQKICDDYLSFDLFPIVYTNHRYNATDYAKYILINDEYSRSGYLLSNNILNTNPDQLALKKICTYKATCWKHEKEWRMILRCILSKKYINWIECKPIAIYLGANISEIFNDILIKYAKNNEIDIFKMDLQMNNNEFKMCYNQIKD